MDISISSRELSKYVDASIIGPDVSFGEVQRFVINCRKYPFAAIAVDMLHTALAKELLKGTGINLVTTVNYPLGGLTPEVQIFHAKEAIRMGADEIDLGMNIGALKSKNYKVIEKAIRGVVEVAKAEGKIVKSVLRCAVLTDEEILTAVQIAKDCGATFVKTNPGFGMVSELRNVEVIRSKYTEEDIKIMVAGGVKDKKQAVEYLNAGAQRVATSHPEKILGIMKFD